MSKTLQAHLALLLVNLIYGANYSIAKQVMPVYVQPFAFVLMRVGGALILFWIVSTLFIKEKVDRKDFPRLALLAVFGVALNQLLFLKGLSITTPINASIIMISNPIVVLIIASLFLKEKISLNKIAGIIFGIGGALLMLTFNKDFSFGSDTIYGDMMILVNSVSWACYVVLVKPLMSKYNTFTIVKWVFLFGFFYVLPFGFYQFGEVDWNNMPLEIWYDVIFVVVATTFLAYVLNTYALRALSPSVVSIYIYLQPFLATLFAIYYYHNDTLDARKLLAAFLIIIGVFLVSNPFSYRKRKIKAE
ncbi:MAG: family transporter [Bacteroidota bacterium]|jgi:drug/metabolite transporter (DMT)-like permease|nr:family transporter [Bacteroidota bacterium]